MKKILLSAAVFFAALTSTAMAYTINIKTGGLAYTGRSLGGQIEYRINGQVVGWEKKLGNTVVYTDPSNSRVGSVEKIGNRWQFKAANNAFAGSVELVGGRHIYKGANGAIIGYADKLGGRTQYKAGNNASIGSADTSAMPLRPIPLENYLKKNKSGAAGDGVCLTRITKIKPDSPAEKAGMEPGDFIISCKGSDWTIFDLLGADHAGMHQKVREKIIATREQEGLVIILYRPAKGEKDQAKGQIVLTAPMPAGMKGYTYLTSASSEYYSSAKSKAYAAGMKEIYTNWLENNR